MLPALPSLTTPARGCCLPHRPLLQRDSSSEPPRFFYLRAFLVEGQVSAPHLVPFTGLLTSCPGHPVAVLSSRNVDFLSLTGTPSCPPGGAGRCPGSFAFGPRLPLEWSGLAGSAAPRPGGEGESGSSFLSGVAFGVGSGIGG